MRMPRAVAAGILVVLVAVGVWLRAGRLAARPFWRDEACVAECVTTGTWADALRPADLPLPPGFAAAVRLSDRIDARPELGLRLPPLVAGCALLPLIYVLARRIGGTRLQALAGVALCTVSLPLIAFSRELKQYALEAFLGTAAAVLVAQIERRPRERPWRSGSMAALLALLAVGPWFGYGFVYPAAALLGYLAWRGVRARRPDMFVAGALASVVLVASFATLYLTVGRYQVSPQLKAHHYPRYLDPRVPRNMLRAALYTADMVSMNVLPMEWTEQLEEHAVVAVPLALLAIWGWRALPRPGRGLVACWLLGALALNVAAALARVYPYGVLRMMLVFIPPLLILLAAGAVAAGRAGTRALLGRPGPGAVCGAAVLLVPLTYIPGLQRRQAFWVYHDVPAVLRQLDAVRSPQEPVLVDLGLAPCVRFYRRPPTGFALPRMVAGTLPPSEAEYREWCRTQMRGLGRRAWLLRSNEPAIVDWSALAEEFGYNFRVEAEAGGPLGGAAQLVLLEKRS